MTGFWAKCSNSRSSHAFLKLFWLNCPSPPHYRPSRVRRDHYHYHDNAHDNHQRLEPLKSCLAVWEDGERANEECFSIGSLATHTDLLKNCEFNIGILKWIYFEIEITFRHLNTGHLLRSQTVSDFSSPWDPSGQPRVKPAF